MTVPRRTKGIPEPGSEGDRAPGAPQEIQTLKERYDRLSHKKTAAETELNGLRMQLEELKRKAREAYGTDDLEELKRKLEAMKRETEEKRAGYQKSLDEIESRLKEVEDRYGEAAGGP